MTKLQALPELRDVATDQQTRRPANLAGHRPRDRFAPGDHAADDRRRALRRFRPAADLDAVHAIEPVSRGPGDAAGLPEKSGQTERHLRAFGGTRSGVGSCGNPASAPRSFRREAPPTGSGSGSAIATASTPIPNGGVVPLSTFTHFESSTAPLSVNHQGQFPVVTISFNLAPNASLGGATQAIDQAEKEIGMPPSIRRRFKERPRRSKPRWPTNRC